jgi:hypothetical protein
VHVLINAKRERRKSANMVERPSVAINIVDPTNPYRYMMIRGRVVGIIAEDLTNHIDKLAKKYLDLDKYPWGKPGDIRQIFKILPEKVVTNLVWDLQPIARS